MKITVYYLICLLILLSCEDHSHIVKDETASRSFQKDLKHPQDETVKTENHQLKTAKVYPAENNIAIVKKYGAQWDFCSCIAVHDSINKAAQKDLTVQQSDQLMKRWESIENQCKEFLINPNTTPEERSLHEKKVKGCLH